MAPQARPPDTVVLVESPLVFNITGGELIIIAVVALIILGPDKLPDFLRRAGRVYGEVKRMSTGFKTEFRDAIEEPVREMQDTVNLAKNWFEEGKAAVGTMDDTRWGTDDDDVETTTSSSAALPAATNEPSASAPAADVPTSGDDTVIETLDDSGDDSDEVFSDEDDDPNFYGEDGQLLTAADLERERRAYEQQTPAQDQFGTVTRRPDGEGTTA